jgi:hypothetical protein
MYKVDASYDGSLLWKYGVFPWVPFIQMHMVINISLDLLIGTWIWTNNFIMKSLWREMCGYLLIKKFIC